MRNDWIRLLAAMCVVFSLGVGCKIIEDSDTSRDAGSTADQHVDVNALPLNVAAAAMGQIPGGTVTRAEKQVINRRQVYSLTVKDGEKSHELIVSPDGQVLSDKVATSATP